MSRGENLVAGIGCAMFVLFSVGSVAVSVAFYYAIVHFALKFW